MTTVSGIVALGYASEFEATLALGCCNALILAVVLSLLQIAHRETVLADDDNGGVVSVSGLLSQPPRSQDPNQVLLDVSFTAAVGTSLSALVLEDFSTRPFWFAFLPQQIIMLVLGIAMIIVHGVLNRSLVLAVSSRYGGGEKAGRRYFGIS